jgi:6-phosphogluconolactonase (cycloisomerase 2 family)
MSYYAYVTNLNDSSLTMYPIDENTGRLATRDIAAGMGTYGIATAQVGEQTYVYTANSTGNSVSMFSIDICGQLQALAPRDIDLGLQPYGITTVHIGDNVYVYTANGGNQSVSMFSIDNSGQLQPLEPPDIFSSQADSYYITTVKVGDNAYAYTTNNNSSLISMFSIDNSGQLQPLAPRDISTGQLPSGIKTVQVGDSTYVYNSNYSIPSSVSMYSIDTSGQLQALAPRDISAGQQTNSITATQLGDSTYLYTANAGEDSVSMYSIDTSGQLQALAPRDISAGIGPYDITTAVVGGQTYVYTANYNTSGSVSQYRIDDTSGNLVALEPRDVLVGTNPISITTAQVNGQTYAYVTNSDGNSVSQYKINEITGQLESLLSQTVSTGLQPYFFTTAEKSGENYLYVANTGEPTVSQYSLNKANGRLTALAPRDISSGTAGVSPSFYITSVEINNERYVYVGNYAIPPDGTVTMYKVDTAGALMPLTPPDISQNISVPSGLTTVLIDGTTYAYVANNSGTIATYTINNVDGVFQTLDVISENIGGPNIMIIVKEQGINYLYVTDNTNKVLMYVIGNTGAITPLAVPDISLNLNTPVSLATIDISGTNYVYVGCNATINPYVVDSSGQLQGLSVFETGKSTPYFLTAVEINNVNYLYATNFDNSIDRYDISGSSGLLTLLESQVSDRDGPFQLSVLYLTNNTTYRTPMSITLADIPDGGYQVELPLYDISGTYRVDWGDGVVDLSNNNTHTYDVSGNYTIQIAVLEDGVSAIGRFGAYDQGWQGSAHVSAINAWGDWNGLKTLRSIGYNSPYNFSVPATVPATVTDMASMFSEAIAFNGAIGGWDVSGVKYMNSMFYNAHAFNEDLSQWNVENVDEMTDMFTVDDNTISLFNQNIGGWNVGNVTDMKSMFDNATAFNQDLSQWPVGNVTTMLDMFVGATGFSQLNYSLTLIGWAALPSLQQSVNLTLADNAAIYDLAVPAYNTLKSYNWTITPDPLPTIQQYRTPMSLTLSDLSGGYQVELPLYDISGIYSVDWGDGVVDLSNNNTHTYDVSGNYTIQIAVPVDGVSAIGSFGAYYQGWPGSAHVSDINAWGDLNGLTRLNCIGYESPYNFSVPATVPATVTDMAGMFGEAFAFDQAIGGWDVSGVKTMNSMFYNAHAFNGDLSQWNVENVEDMKYMFGVDANTISLFNQNIGGWDVGQVTNMNSMFDRATSFNQDLSQWPVGNVTTMLYMFSGATAFSQLNYSLTLIGWAALPSLYSGVTLTLADNAAIYDYAWPSYDILTGEPNNWIISLIRPNVVVYWTPSPYNQLNKEEALKLTYNVIKDLI